MNHLNDFPKRDNNHKIETKAEAAFESFLANSDNFIAQSKDRKDYGTDYQLEVIDRGCATNVRLPVQLKGTEKAFNLDGTISIEVSRPNLNYLTMGPYSFYSCYHVHSDSLWICSASEVLRRYEHSGKNWWEQATLTVKFGERLTNEHLNKMAALVKEDAVSSRDKRVAQAVALPKDVPNIIKHTLPDFHVPEDVIRAAELLSNLYNSGADEQISANFDQFASVCGSSSDEMISCYMAEINLGMARRSPHFERINDGILYLEAQLDTDKYDSGSLHYSIGNAFSALGKEQAAVEAYQRCVKCINAVSLPGLLSQCHKNLGSSFEKLGENKKAVDCFYDALKYDPNLAEAHFALGNHYHQTGEFEEALKHFDSIVFLDGTLGKMSAIVGWRINILFNLDDGRGAFREINSLLTDADNESWIWPWCATQVAIFGRASVENARASLTFWTRYLGTHPEDSSAVEQSLLAKLYLQSHGEDFVASYDQFKTEFEKDIIPIEAKSAAFLWDRLGHWAQDESDWVEAEWCFRKAFELEGGHYGYCLGTALNFLERYEESLPILLDQAEKHQPDAKSWFQVAVANEHLEHTENAILAYRKAIELNPNYELARFNLGGVYWNSGDFVAAGEVWKAAVKLFPEHELALKLHRELPEILI